MKAYHIKDLLKKELLILELPKVCDYELDEDMIWVINLENGFTYRAEGSYTLLGKPDEIKEEDARELVEPPIDKWGDDKFRFLDYRYDGYYDLFTATKSLLSALENEILWDVNPLGDEPIKYHTVDFYGNPRISRTWSKWHKTELRTFDRNRSIILVKN